MSADEREPDQQIVNLEQNLNANKRLDAQNVQYLAKTLLEGREPLTRKMKTSDWICRILTCGCCCSDRTKMGRQTLRADSRVNSALDIVGLLRKVRRLDLMHKIRTTKAQRLMLEVQNDYVVDS